MGTPSCLSLEPLVLTLSQVQLRVHNVKQLLGLCPGQGDFDASQGGCAPQEETGCIPPRITSEPSRPQD